MIHGSHNSDFIQNCQLGKGWKGMQLKEFTFNFSTLFGTASSFLFLKTLIAYDFLSCFDSPK